LKLQTLLCGSMLFVAYITSEYIPLFF
jgi:hypothetical protein